MFVPNVNGKFGLIETRKQVAAALGPEERASNIIGIYSGRAPRDYRGWENDKRITAEKFKANEVPVLVSTKAFGMGIDKPNIRWTVHLGFPGSIEAYAQEAGRAGRDGQPAQCVIVASAPPAERAEALLSPTNHDGHPPQERSRDDLDRQLFFIGNGFPGVEQEYRKAAAVLSELLPAGPGNRIVIPFSTQRDEQDKDRGEREKALYRLAIVGVVDDYTVDFGSRSFTVDLRPFTSQSLDDAMMDFVTRVEPGRTQARRQELESAPADVEHHIRHHLKMVLRILYDVIQPARLRALAEMYQLAASQLADTDIRARILAYLSDGPLAGILSELATASSVDVDRLTKELNTVPATDPSEWVGASARQLEAYPDHPILLLTRALGEAMLPQPDLALVAATANDALAALSRYQVPAGDAARLMQWACAQLRNQHGGRAWPAVPLLYHAWRRSEYPLDALNEMENQVLTQATRGRFHPLEVRAVVQHRMILHARAVTAISQHLSTQGTPE